MITWFLNQFLKSEIMEKLLEFIKQYIEVSSEDLENISQYFEIKEFKKNETIHHNGDIFKSIMLINSGIARSYVIKEDGKDFTWHFHFSNDESKNLKNIFIVDYASFTHQEPSKMYFEALEDCEVFIMEYESLEKLYNSDIKWQYLGRMIAQDAYYLTHHRTISLLTLTANERLDNLLDECPNIFNLVPHYHIASFLGVSPQHLSRLRKP